MMLITITITLIMIVIMRNLMPESFMVMLWKLILMLIVMIMAKNSILRDIILSAKIMKVSMIIAIMQANIGRLHTVFVI